MEVERESRLDRVDRSRERGRRRRDESRRSEPLDHRRKSRPYAAVEKATSTIGRVGGRTETKAALRRGIAEDMV